MHADVMHRLMLVELVRPLGTNLGTAEIFC